MTPTAPLQLRAERATIYANAARKSRKASRAKTHTAILLTALDLAYGIRRSGGHVSRKVESILRGKQ